MNAPAPTPVRAHGKWKLILLAALFAGPVVLATVLYNLNWRPQGNVNYGELVQPARPLTDVPLQTWDGKPVPAGTLWKKWSLVYFAGSDCGEVCRADLYKMRQVHATQAQERDRVQRVMVLTTPQIPAWLAEALRDYPDMQVVTGSEENVRALAQQFVLPAGGPLDRLERIYVIDPLGNLMMSYPANADPSRMRKDLKRLLKISQIG